MINKETLRDLICEHQVVRKDYADQKISFNDMIERATQIEDDIYDIITGEYIEENERQCKQGNNK